MNYGNIILYVMSGTGNTLRAAQWIREIAESESVSAEIRMVEHADPPENPARDTLTFIMFPAHGLMPPWSMIKFLFRIMQGNRTPAVILSTRGGVKLGPVVIPGAVGFGNFFAAIILLIKRYRIRGMFSLDMPVNMINIHWGMNYENTSLILNRAKNKISGVMDRIIIGRRVFYPGNITWELLWAVLLFGFIPLFPILYLLTGKLFMAKLMFADNRCSGCGLCARFCPNKAITMKQAGEINRPFWTYHCEACLRCMAFCKKNAVQAGHSWGVLLYCITAIPVITWCLHKTNLTSALPGIDNFWINQLYGLVYIIPAILISYRIFWMLMRIPLLNRLFTYTAFTRYFRRYHEPETDLKDFK